MISVDSNGIPYKYRTYFLDKKEYAKIMSEINNDYEIYKDKEIASHFSIGIDDKYYIYYFENHGFNEYNIIGRISL